jgi:hypothetical protein
MQRPEEGFSKYYKEDEYGSYLPKSFVENLEKRYKELQNKHMYDAIDVDPELANDIPRLEFIVQSKVNKSLLKEMGINYERIFDVEYAEKLQKVKGE